MVDGLGDIAAGTLPQAPYLVRLLRLGSANDDGDILGQVVFGKHAGGLKAIDRKSVV